MPDDRLEQYTRAMLAGETTPALQSPTLAHYASVLQTLISVLKLTVPLLQDPMTKQPAFSKPIIATVSVNLAAMFESSGKIRAYQRPDTNPRRGRHSAETWHVDLVKMFADGMDKDSTVPLFRSALMLAPLGRLFLLHGAICAFIRGHKLTRSKPIPETEPAVFTITLEESPTRFTELDLETQQKPLRKEVLTSLLENLKQHQGPKSEGKIYVKLNELVKGGGSIEAIRNFLAENSEILGDENADKYNMKIPKNMWDYLRAKKIGDELKISFQPDLDTLNLKDDPDEFCKFFNTDIHKITGLNKEIKEFHFDTRDQKNNQAASTFLSNGIGGMKALVTQMLASVENNRISEFAGIYLVVVTFLNLIWRAYVKQVADGALTDETFRISQFVLTEEIKENLTFEQEIVNVADYGLKIAAEGANTGDPFSDYIEVFFKGKAFSTTFKKKQQEIMNYFSKHKDNPPDFVLGGVIGTKIEFSHISGMLMDDLRKQFSRWKGGQDDQAAQDIKDILSSGV